MTMAERIISTQKENLKKVHNTRFTHNGYEYKLTYDGGVAEFISIFGRKEGTLPYRYVDGFCGYKFYDYMQAIEYAKNLISSRT